MRKYEVDIISTMSLTNSLNTKVTSAMKGFKMEATDAMKIVDKFTALDVQAATTAGDIAEGLAQFANVATLNGVDIDEAAAMVATIADVTQQSGSSVGNSLKMMMSRFSNVKSGAFTSDEGDTEALNDTERVLNKIGVSMRDANLQFRTFSDVLADIAEKWDSLDNISQNAIAGAIAGTRQREGFVTLMQNYTKYEDLLEVSKGSTGTAEKKYKSYQEQLEAQQKKLKAAWEDFANSADVQRLLIDINKIATGLVKILPYITKYVARYLAINQAYKIPGAVKSIGRFILPKSFGKGDGSTFSEIIHDFFGGRSHNSTMASYNKELNTKTWSTIWKANTQALRENTAALRGENGTNWSKSSTGAPYIMAGGIGLNAPGSTAVLGGALDANNIKIGYTKLDAFDNMSYQNGKLVDKNWYNESIGDMVAEKDNAVAFALYSFDNRKDNNFVKTDGGYYYNDANGNQTFIRTRDFNTYQRKAQMTAYQNYAKKKLTADDTTHKSEIGKTQMQLDQKWLNDYALSGRQQADTQLLSQYSQGNNGQWYKLGEDGKRHAITDANELKNVKGAARRQEISAQKQGNVKSAAGSKAASAAAIAGMAINGVAGAATGALTASTTSKVNGTEYKMSSGAEAVSRSTTGLIQGLGSMVSPALGSLLGIGMDALNTYVIGPMIDGANIHMQERIKEAQTKLTSFSNIKTDIATVKTLSQKDLWTAEDVAENEKAVDSIIDKMYAKDADGKDVNIRARESLLSNLQDILKNQGLEIKSLGDIADASRSSEEQRLIAHALELAEAQSSRDALLDSYEEQYSDLAKDKRNVFGDVRGDIGYDKSFSDSLGENMAGIGAGALTTGVGIGGGILAGLATGAAVGATSTGPFAWAGAIIGGIIGAAAGAATGIAAKKAAEEKNEQAASAAWYGLGYNGQIDVLEKRIAEEEKKGKSADQEMISKLQDSINTLREIRDQTKAINKKVDQASTAEALLGAVNGNGEYLSMMNNNQLKAMGVDEIKRAVADYLVQNGGLLNSDVYLSNGQLTTYANQMITGALKTDTTYGGVVSGQSYTLSEALKLKKTSANGLLNQSNIDILQNFASALHVSINELNAFEDKYGTLTLKDFLMTATESIEKLKDIGSLMSDIANTNKSWAETQKNIISNYPELVQYMNDSKALQSALWNQSSKYAEIQLQGLYDELAGSSGYYSSTILPMIESQGFYDKLQNNDDFARVNDVSSLLKWAMKYQNSSEYGDIANQIDKLVQEELQKAELVSDLMKEQLNTVVQYQETLLQNEIDNLTEQKNALSEINKQREYENTLIEAKLKLENAQKEKKRVYREGVGWVYESDQSAITEAETNLSDVENQKIESKLEAQITQLEADKKTLEDMSNEEMYEEQKALYDSWVEKYEGENGPIQSIVDFKEAVAGENSLITTADKIYDELHEQFQKEADAAINGTQIDGNHVDGLKDLYSKLLKAKDELDANPNSEEAKANYNSALQAYQSAYNNANSSGYINQDTFDNSLDSLVFGSTQSKNAALGIEGWTERDLTPTAYVKTESGSWYKLTMDPTSSLEDSEVEQIWGDWDKGGHHGQAWDEAYTGQRSASGASTKGYLKDDFSNLQAYARAHPNSWGLGDSTNKTWFGVDKAGVLRKVAYQSIDYKDIPANYRDDTTIESSYSNVYSNHKKATGDLSFTGGAALINELGTEALITPDGTITSLPSRTGIIPADITKNLWQLGELSPMIANALLGGVSGSDFGSKSYMNSVDESLNINSLIMNVSADNSFDVDAFANALRTRMALSKNNKR